jgi:hypothetical protein
MGTGGWLDYVEQILTALILKIGERSVTAVSTGTISQAVTSIAVLTTTPTQPYSIISTTISSSAYNLKYVVATTPTEFSVVGTNAQTTTMGYVDAEGNWLSNIVIG